MAILGTRCPTDAELDLIANEVDSIEVRTNSDAESLVNILRELKLLNVNMGEATDSHFTLEDIEDCP